jgi:hypothetical protein
MYISHTSVMPWYDLQGPYPKPTTFIPEEPTTFIPEELTTFIPEEPTTFYRLTHQMSSTFILLLHSCPRSIG